MSNFDWGILEQFSWPTSIKTDDYSNKGFPNIKFLKENDKVKLIDNYKYHPKYIDLSDKTKHGLDMINEMVSVYGYISVNRYSGYDYATFFSNPICIHLSLLQYANPEEAFQIKKRELEKQIETYKGCIEQSEKSLENITEYFNERRSIK